MTHIQACRLYGTWKSVVLGLFLAERQKAQEFHVNTLPLLSLSCDEGSLPLTWVAYETIVHKVHQQLVMRNCVEGLEEI